MAPVALLAAGLVIMLTISSVISDAKIACLVILGALIAFNFISAYFLGLAGRLRKFWAVKYAWHLIPGFVLGLIPIGGAYMFLSSKGELPPFKGIALTGALFTFATIAWEEVWFRGTALEAAGSRYSKIGAAMVFGLIFALLHILNPKIDLFQDGLQLFVAGYALSVCYFAFQSIWAPIGMHFANNLTQALFGLSTEPRSFAFHVPLALIALGLTVAVRKSHSESHAK